MKIVVITYAYPPFPVVGSFRAANIAESFRAAGHDVHVVTLRLTGETGRMRVSEPGFRVETVHALPGPLQVYRKARRLFGDSAEEATDDSPNEAPDPHALVDHVPTWKRYILSALAVPDIHQGYIPPALLAVLRACRGGADMIYSTAPPFSVHLIGLAAKRVTGTRWVAEFRDPWTENPARLPHLRSRAADAAHRWLESLCISSADQVVAVSESVHRALQAGADPADRDRFVLVRNGIDVAPGQAAAPREGPFRIVYTGGMHHNYDPRPFLHGLAAVRAERELGSDDLRVQFVGRCRWYGDILLEKLVNDLGLAEIVEFRDWVPQDICRELQAKADLLLLLAQGRPAQVPNKLYDYLGMRRPILAFATEESESAGMLRRVGGHYIVTDDEPSSAKHAIESVLDAHESGLPFEYDEELLEEWSTSRQMERLRLAVGV